MNKGSEIDWAVPADDAAVADFIASAILAKGGGRIAVPGGSTPAPILRALARHPLDWTRVTFTLSDDRDVPHDHPASNFGALRAALGGTGARLEPLAEGPDPGRFDLVWVGMGQDGHVASIFPNMRVSADAAPAVIRDTPEPLPPEAPFPRLSLNYAALTDTDRLILVLRGEAKKSLIVDAIAGRHDLPVARLLSRADGPVTIFWNKQ
jgi:6-phosphogluconolactonase